VTPRALGVVLASDVGVLGGDGGRGTEPVPHVLGRVVELVNLPREPREPIEELAVPSLRRGREDGSEDRCRERRTLRVSLACCEPQRPGEHHRRVPRGRWVARMLPAPLFRFREESPGLLEMGLGRLGGSPQMDHRGEHMIQAFELAAQRGREREGVAAPAALFLHLERDGRGDEADHGRSEEPGDGAPLHRRGLGLRRAIQDTLRVCGWAPRSTNTVCRNKRYFPQNADIAARRSNPSCLHSR